MTGLFDYIKKNNIKEIVKESDAADWISKDWSNGWSKDTLYSIFQWTKHTLRQHISDNDRVNGWILFLLHFILQILVYFALLISPIHSVTFVGALVFWVLILLSNICFRGCLLLKMERYLWNTRSWYGPMYLFCEEEYITPNLANNFFICRQVLVVTIIFLRFLFSS